MTKLEIILMFTTFAAISWAGMITLLALYIIKKSKRKVRYYQNPEVQHRLARHVIKHRFSLNQEDVFK